MNRVVQKVSVLSLPSISVVSQRFKSFSCKVLVIGGGTGGCAMSAKFTRRLGKDAVIVLEPSMFHYYQPLWTLVGVGATKFIDTRRSEHSVLPDKCIWVKDFAQDIDPEKMIVTTKTGHNIHYEYLIVAVGLQNNYEKIPGLEEGLNDPKSGISTIYSPDYCEKVWRDLQSFKGGEAIFTYPDSLIKCPGAPQKIAYMTDSYLNKTNLRSKANITYNTSLPVIFGVKKYADVLLKIVERKKIKVNYKTLLKAIDVEKKEALFVHKEDPSKQLTMPYNLLHVTPPMSTPSFLKTNSKLVDAAGYLDVDKYTLQHKKYSNIYGIGDCTNTPNSKTGAAISKQSFVVEHNLLATMSAHSPHTQYDGYGACPLVTEYNRCVLAEFLYDGVVHETMPFNQATESIITYQMKKHLFPFIYWNFLLTGYYHGPEFVRRILHPLTRLKRFAPVTISRD